MRRYTVVLMPELDEGGYSVAVPALPGCYTQGETREEALTNARQAIQAYLSDALASGEQLPEERSAPELVAIEINEVEYAR